MDKIEGRARLGLGVYLRNLHQSHPVSATDKSDTLLPALPSNWFVKKMKGTSSEPKSLLIPQAKATNNNPHINAGTQEPQVR